MIREKIIFVGQVDAHPDAIEMEIQIFFAELSEQLSSIDIEFEIVGHKQVWIITPRQSATNEKIVNGYIEITPLSLAPNSDANLRIVSCREELDLLYFQLSQRIQARFLIPDIDYSVAMIPWAEFVEKGYISSENTDPVDLLYKLNNPDDTVMKYGTDRDLTKADVIRAVRSCRAWMARGGTAESWLYDSDYWREPKCSLDTLYKWLQNPELNP